MRPFVFAIASIAITCIASLCQAVEKPEKAVQSIVVEHCCVRPIAVVPAYYLVPVTPRGVALAGRRAGYNTPLAVRWLPGDFFRGRGVIVVPQR